MEVVIVDEEGNIIGSEEKGIALKKELIRRIVRILVFNKEGKLFLQKRSMKMETFPGWRDQSAGGHVDEGESVETAAHREFKEELGIDDVKLKEGPSFLHEERTEEGKLLRDFSTLFITNFDGEINIDKEEVTDGNWFSLEEIKELPKVTLGCLHALKEYEKAF